MKRHGALLVFMLLACAKPIFAGPPFQTDDPDPVDFHHYEFYVFRQRGRHRRGNGHGRAGSGIQLGNSAEHTIPLVVPLAAIVPSNEAKYAPAGVGPSEVGLGDIEIGVKYR